MHQIDNTFTRLEPGIVLPDSAFASSPNTVCVLGEPPARFAAVHSKPLLNAWYRKLQSSLDRPIQEEQRRGHRRVQVLGSVVFDFVSSGTVQAFVWDFDENDRIGLRQVAGVALVLQGAPEGALWMDPYKQAALRALRQRHPCQSALTRAYVQWAHARLVKIFWDRATQDQVRYQVSVALDLDLQAMDVATQIQRTGSPDPLVHMDTYNHAITHAKDYATLKKEAPQLVFLFGLLADELGYFSRMRFPEVTAWLRGILMVDQLKPAFWRLLCRVGTDWMREFLPYFDLERSDRAFAALDILRMAQAFGTRELVPNWMLHAFMQLGGNPNAPSSRYCERLYDLFPLCARLGHLWIQADDADRALIQEHALDIWDWACDHLDHHQQDFARRVRLRGLLRRVAEQQRLDQVQAMGGQGWKSAYELHLHHARQSGQRHSGQNQAIEAVILDSPLAIWQEARTMHHCADKYTWKCANGQLLMVSLRSASCNRPLATVAFDLRTKAVRQTHIAGFANTLVSPEVRKLAQVCRRQLQQQHPGFHPVKDQIKESA